MGLINYRLASGRVPQRIWRMFRGTPRNLDQYLRFRPKFTISWRSYNARPSLWEPLWFSSTLRWGTISWTPQAAFSSWPWCSCSSESCLHTSRIFSRKQECRTSKPRLPHNCSSFIVSKVKDRLFLHTSSAPLACGWRHQEETTGISISSFFTILFNFAFLGWIGTTFPLLLSPKTRRIEAGRSLGFLLMLLEGQSNNWSISI